MQTGTEPEPVAQLPPEIRVSDWPVSIGRGGYAEFRLQDETISPLHASLSRADGILRLEDHDSTCGTFVNGDRIKLKTLAPEDVVRFGLSVTYRVENDCLKYDEKPQGMPLFGGNVALAKSGKVLLEDIHFRIAPSSFVGLLGPSGAGKSTLLQAMAGYLRPYHGHILGDDGADIFDDTERFHRSVGLVTQDDIIYSSLTIRENLAFAARLRFGTEPGDRDLDELVTQTLKRLAIDTAADNRQYSGGQRKRLSVAIELLKRPRLLLLDEPTSGLDPASEAALMDRLKLITKQGTTVVCTTHQLENLGLFDHVIVLGLLPSPRDAKRVGKIAYSGSPSGLLSSFDCQTFADLFEILSRGQFQPLASSQSPPARLLARDSPAAASPNLPTEEEFTLAALGDSSMRAIQDIGQQLFDVASDASLWSQVKLQLLRRVLLIIRDPKLLMSIIAQPVLLGTLMAISQFRSGAASTVEFFLVVIALWLGMNNSVRDFVRDRKTYVRERQAGLLPNAYFLSRCIEHSILGALQILALLIVTVIVGGVFMSNDTQNDLWLNRGISSLFAILFLTLQGGVGLGLLVSAIVNTEEAAVAALPLLIMPQLLLSAVASGHALSPYNRPRPFQPLVSTIDVEKNTEGIAADILSMVCLSRPASLLAESPESGVWLADLCHLMILVTAVWTATYALFLKQEKTWPKIIGLG